MDSEQVLVSDLKKPWVAGRSEAVDRIKQRALADDEILT